MRSRARMLMTLRAQHEEQPSDVALCVHESLGGKHCADPRRPLAATLTWTRKDFAPGVGRNVRPGTVGSSVPVAAFAAPHHYGWGRAGRSFFVPARDANHRRILRVGGP
jgi:hypothetical protein